MFPQEDFSSSPRTFFRRNSPNPKRIFLKEEGGTRPRCNGLLKEEGGTRTNGLKRRFSESARDLSAERLGRLARFSDGLRRRLSVSTKDLWSNSGGIGLSRFKQTKYFSDLLTRGFPDHWSKRQYDFTEEPWEDKKLDFVGLHYHHRQLSSSLKDLLVESSGTHQRERKNTIKKLTRRLSFLTEAMLGKFEKSGTPKIARTFRKARTIEVEVLQPDDTKTFIRGEDSQSIRQFLRPLTEALRISSFSLYLEESQAEVDLEAPAMLLNGDKVILRRRDKKDSAADDDSGIHLTKEIILPKEILASEKEFLRHLKGVEILYGRPLLTLGTITHEEHQKLFRGIQRVIEASEELCEKLELAIESWSCGYFHIKLRNIFTENIWDKFEEYLKDRPTAELTLQEMESQDEEFMEFCKLQRGAAKHTLASLLHLPSERLSAYEQYFASLLVDTPSEHPDYGDLSGAHEKLRRLVEPRGDDYTELERIQELFPNDNLKLYERNPVSQKMKGLIRKRSATAARLQRAFSAKGLRATEGHSPAKDGDCDCGSTEDASREAKPKRQFIMETPVQFTTGVQSQERHLFLFSDLLLVAKSRSGGNFKLKEKVRVSEMWLANCLDDVTEVSKCSDTSFVMGWPTTNVVASFGYVATKDLWYNKLSQMIAEERDKEPSSTTIQVTYYDPVSNSDICKTLNISSTTTAKECISIALAHLELTCGNEDKFQLWVKCPNEDSPYPLIGHELPFAIRMNCLREIMQECNVEPSVNLYNTDVIGRCQFILRQGRRSCRQNGLVESPLERGKKVSKKARKSPIRIHRVFKRSSSKGDVTDGCPQSHTRGTLFAHPLSTICSHDGIPPKAVMVLLHQLLQKGPFTVGIFRKSANARLVRELREKLDSGEDIGDPDRIPITAVAALFKEFLRTLPDCLLCCDLYEEWLQLPNIPAGRERISRVLLLSSRLPRPHLTLLQYFLCVLHHIAKRAAENMMSASNLAVCVGPSLLWPASLILAINPEASKQAPATVEYLIEKCCNIFGKDILSLMGDPPESDPLRQDSGAEESDSLHSLHSGHSLHSSGGLRRDDSSIDSLERELLGEGELSPLPRKDKMSLTNLSRDSGLTMSDSQLYTPDDEESESNSSGHSGGLQQSSFQHYPAPNNPNAIYTAIYKRPEKAQGKYDEPDAFYSATPREHTRVHITYSSPNYSHQLLPKLYHDQRKSADEDAIYSVPGVGGSSQHLPSFVANSNFQRHDWMRRCSHLKKISKSNGVDVGMMRSTSEESLLNKYNAIDYGVSLGASGNAIIVGGSNDYYSKGRVEESTGPYSPIGERDSFLRRSKSAHHIVDGYEPRSRLSPQVTPVTSKVVQREGNVKWLRSRSTPHIHEEGDRSYDSSTLSDADSTPHVSRSNSRGKECGSGCLHPWESSDSHNSRNSSFKSERTGSMCTVVSAGSTSTLSSNPPPYEEALTRRSLIQNGPSPATGIPDYAIREEKLKSAKAKQLYDESLRIYREETTCDLVRASPAHAHDGDEAPPPLPPKCEPPPLPPKQNSSRKSSEGTIKLKQLPPVHVETANRKARSVTSFPSHQIIYDPPIHKTIIYTADLPPLLPPKEKTVIEVEASSYRPCVEKKSIETQTDDCDLLDEDEVRDESIQTSGRWVDQIHVTSVPVPDTSFQEGRSRGRAKRKNSDSRRSRSMPVRDHLSRHVTSSRYENDEDWESYEDSRDFSSKGYGFRDPRHLDPDLQEEISWSVSQLRAIFGDSLKGAKVHPPPYRPPPAAHRMPITSYHVVPEEDYTCRKQRPRSTYEEESYV